VRQYHHILLAVELNPEVDDTLIAKVKELASDGVKMTCVHSIEHMSSFGAAYTVSAGIDVEEELAKEARSAMAEIASELGLNADDQLVEIGMAKQVILDAAKKLGADLIVVGSHGRHGARLLLGSTANAVLHGAQCDVLAVRVQDDTF